MTHTRPWPLPESADVNVQHFSDTHFGYRPWSYREGDHMLADLGRPMTPYADITVHTGDITDNGYGSQDTYAESWLYMATDGRPFLVVPGNHDLRDRPSTTRQAWEAAWGRPANSFVDVNGYRFIGFSADQHGWNDPWLIPPATWSWLEGVVSSAPGPVILADHFPLWELLVAEKNAVQPAAVMTEFISSHPSIVGMLAGHMHWEIEDQRQARFVAVGNRDHFPIITDVSSMLSISNLGRDYSGRYESISAHISMWEDRWDIRYRRHGRSAWSGPDDQRVTSLCLTTGTVTRHM